MGPMGLVVLPLLGCAFLAKARKSTICEGVNFAISILLIKIEKDKNNFEDYSSFLYAAT
jgi:hypothetical protein